MDSSSANMSANMTVMAAAAEGAGRWLPRDFGEIQQLQSSNGAPEKFAAVAYSKVEKTLVTALLETRPKYGILSPGQDMRGADISHRFIIQPIDGIEFFTRGLATFAITIALQEQSAIVAAIVYEPLFDRMYFAERGAGVFVREARLTRRIRVSKRSAGGLIIGADSSLGSTMGTNSSKFFGADSVALSLLAAGAIDGFIGRGRSIFNISAGSFIANEAGAKISTPDADTMVAENGSFQPSLCDIILKSKKEA